MDLSPLFSALLIFPFGYQRLPGDAQGRPAEFSWWAKRARKYSMPPSVDNVPSFATAFNTWWSQMKVDGEDGWGVLRVGGPNGILVVMLLLCWWGREVVTPQWKAAVDDVTACLDKMSNGKRASGAAEPSARKSTRYVLSVLLYRVDLIYY
jgi:hypothetical protein